MYGLQRCSYTLVEGWEGVTRLQVEFLLYTEKWWKYKNLLGARLASAPATDKIDGRGALRDPMEVRLI